MKKRSHAFVLLLITSIIWGVAVPVIKATGVSFPPALFLTYRFLISTIVGAVYFYFNPLQISMIRKKWPEVLKHSLFTVGLGLGFLFLGLNYTDSVTGAILAATGPMFAVVAGAWFLREKITQNEIVGIGIAIFGSGIITVPTGQLSISLELLSLMGAFFIIVSRFFDAIGAVYVKKSLTAGLQPEAIAHTSFIVGFIIFSLVSLFILPVASSVNQIVSAPLSAHLGVLYMALISGTFAYSLQAKALSTLHIGEASIFAYITPLWATPVAVIWLKEGISVKFIVGATIIAIGVAIAEYHKRKRRIQPSGIVRKHRV